MMFPIVFPHDKIFKSKLVTEEICKHQYFTIDLLLMISLLMCCEWSKPGKNVLILL